MAMKVGNEINCFCFTPTLFPAQFRAVSTFLGRNQGLVTLIIISIITASLSK